MAKQQWEEEAKDRFLRVLRNERGSSWRVLAEDVVVDTAKGTNYDYELGSDKTDDQPVALEIFRLIEDEGDLARDRTRAEITQLLKSELLSRGIKDYAIRTPWNFLVSKAKRLKYVQDLADKLEQAIKVHPDNSELKVEGFSLTKAEGIGTIFFSSAGQVRVIDPPGSALSALANKLPDKNEQLVVTGHERLLLIVNWAHLVSTKDAIEACSRIDFAVLPNIDKVYFESHPDKCELIFDRQVFEVFEKQTEPPPAQLEALYMRWLEYRLNYKDPKAFDLVKRRIAQEGNALWLPAFSRVEVLFYGERFVTQGDFDNALWIVRNFKDDPDPGIANEADDKEGSFNYHEQIKRGEEPYIITTVRGHLCWLLQKIIVANRPEFYPELTNVVESYVAGENLYIRQQATVPLVELAIRRTSRLPDGTPLMSSDLADQVRHLAFRLLRENTAYPTLLKWIAHVFSRMRDLREEEAREVLETLLRYAPHHAIEDISDLMLFFALFREHWEGFGAFDSGYFVELLRNHIINGAEDIRAYLIWLMEELIEKQNIEFSVFQPLIQLFPEGPYSDTGFAHFYRILAGHIHEAPEPLCQALRKALEREKEFVEANHEKMIWYFNYVETCLRELAKSDDRQCLLCLLECIVILLQYRNKIWVFPTETVSKIIVEVTRKLTGE